MYTAPDHDPVRVIDLPSGSRAASPRLSRSPYQWRLAGLFIGQGCTKSASVHIAEIIDRVLYGNYCARLW